jgi:hypothetical protein
MRPIKPRLWQIMLAVAVLAGLFAVFGVIEAVVIAAIFLPILLAGPGRRLSVAVWVAAIYPVLIAASLYATWITAWCVLGHRPRVSLDDPKSISPIVDVVGAAPDILLEVGIPVIWFALAPALLAVLGWNTAKKRLSPRQGALHVLIPVCAWFATYVFLLCDPGWVVMWYLD